MAGCEAPVPTPPVSLKDVLDAAWAQHPESRALPGRRDAAQAQQWAADTWAAIEALTKAMRKAGYPKLRKAPQKAADAPMPGQAGLPLGDAPEAPGNAS